MQIGTVVISECATVGCELISTLPWGRRAQVAQLISPRRTAIATACVRLVARSRLTSA